MRKKKKNVLEGIDFHQVQDLQSFGFKVFDVGKHTMRRTISLPEGMKEPLILLAKKRNETVPRIIVSALEEYLVKLAVNGSIPWPDAFTKLREALQKKRQ